MESSHDIVESSRYIPRDRSHMRTTEIELNSGAIMAKKLTNLKSLTLMLERNAFGCILGRPIICVWRYFYTLPFCLHLNLSITYDKIPGIFKQENPFSRERGEKEILIFR